MSKTSTTPFNNLNFFQNYNAHLNEFTQHVRSACGEYYHSTNGQRLSILGSHTLKRLRMLDPFYDRFDIADEVLGATVVPFLLAATSIALTLVAAWQAGYMLAIKAGLVRNDHESHGDRAVMFFLGALALSASAVIFFVKSAVSLLTRTLVTMLDGKATPYEVRFNKTPHFAKAVGILGFMAVNQLSSDTEDDSIVYSLK